MNTEIEKKDCALEEFPPGFPERLESFLELTGMSWGELAACLGVQYERVMSWRKGAEPRGSALSDLMRLARRVPGGMDVLFPGVTATFGLED